MKSENIWVLKIIYTLCIFVKRTNLPAEGLHGIVVAALVPDLEGSLVDSDVGHSC